MARRTDGVLDGVTDMRSGLADSAFGGEAARWPIEWQVFLLMRARDLPSSHGPICSFTARLQSAQCQSPVGDSRSS